MAEDGRGAEEGRKTHQPTGLWNQEEREDCKLKKKTSWYQAGGYSTVIFCTYTPNSVLAKRWREVEERGVATRGWRYQVVELGGDQSYRQSSDSSGAFPVGSLRSALFALLVAGVPVPDLAVPTKYSVWPA